MEEDAAAVIRDLRGSLVGSLALYTGDEGLAEDLAQEAFARMVERWAQVRVMERPAAWVWRVAFNLARSGFRRAGMHRRVLRLLRAQPPEETGPGLATSMGLRQEGAGPAAPHRPAGRPRGQTGRRRAGGRRPPLEGGQASVAPDAIGPAGWYVLSATTVAEEGHWSDGMRPVTGEVWLGQAVQIVEEGLDRSMAAAQPIPPAAAVDLCDTADCAAPARLPTIPWAGWPTVDQLTRGTVLVHVEGGELVEGVIPMLGVPMLDASQSTPCEAPRRSGAPPPPTSATRSSRSRSRSQSRSPSRLTARQQQRCRATGQGCPRPPTSSDARSPSHWSATRDTGGR